MNKAIISIYTEQTPNPENIKFVTNRMLYAGNNVDYPDAKSVNGTSAFADALFALDFVRNVFIANNFVTIGKASPDLDWYEIIPDIKSAIKGFLETEEEVVNESALQKAVEKEAESINEEVAEDDLEMADKIKSMLAKYVQPAVEMDGGSIVFKGYNDGIVTVGMQGACSGCPSSTITLKAGIEGMMKRMIPEVKEVVAEAM